MCYNLITGETAWVGAKNLGKLSWLDCSSVVTCGRDPSSPFPHLWNEDKIAGWTPFTPALAWSALLHHPAELRKNHPMAGNSTHSRSWMHSEGWGASSRWVIWLKGWLSVVLATHPTTNSHFIWSPWWCSNHRFPGPASSQEMEAKQQMIHISSNTASQKLPAAETATNLLRLWPELLPLLPWPRGLEAAWPLTDFSPKREGEKEIKEERREEESWANSCREPIWRHQPLTYTVSCTCTHIVRQILDAHSLVHCLIPH